MRRRSFVLLLCATTASPLFAYSQPRTPRVGILWHGANEEEEAIYLGAVRQGLKDFGYVEGKSVILENRFPAEMPERFASLAADLVASKVDVLVAITGPAALAAQHATTTIPIVFVAVPDPVGAKLVASLAHPGGNITGLSNFARDLTGKRVELLKQITPSISRIALIVNPNDKANAQVFTDEAQSAADRLHLTLQTFEIKNRADVTPAFQQMRDRQIDGVVVSQNGLFFVARKDIADAAAAAHLPLTVFSKETVDAGALASYGPSNYGIFRRSGYYIDKILHGTNPAEIPVEQPTKFEFIINLRTAKELGITVPQNMLVAADDVIE
jgi:putative tryptophan/tyrosine transport system substrate-binding protein